MTLSECEAVVDRSWLISALDHARSLGGSDIVDYLQSVADDVIFEAEMAGRRASLLSRLM